MQLRRLEVKNIRSFVSGELDLGPGTTLLVGDVGAGKSSLLYAAEMALFGGAEVDPAYLVRHGTQHAEVAVTLEDGEHAYTLRRRFRKVRRRGRETFEPERLTFAQDGRPTAYSATEIRQRVIDLLGFPDNPNPHAHSDLWRWAIYVPQERMREILAADPEERLETVRKALGVERYRIAAENAQLLASDLRGSARRRKEEAARLGHWDVEFAAATKEADRLRADRAALTSAAERAARELENARGRRGGAEEQLGRREAERAELARLAREGLEDEGARSNLQARSGRLRDEAASARTEAAALRASAGDLPRLRGEVEQADAELRRLRADRDRHASALAELAAARSSLAAADRRVADARTRRDRSAADRDATARELSDLVAQPPVKEPVSPTQRALPDLERDLTVAVASERKAVENVAGARTRLEQLVRLLAAGTCPTCGQPVEPADFGPHRVEAEAALAAAEAERVARSAEREHLDDERKARDRYERALERWTDIERQRAAVRERVARATSDLGAAETSLEQALRERELLRQHADELRPAESTEANLRADVARAEARGRDVADAEHRAAAAVERVRAVEELAARALAEEARIGEDLAALERRMVERAHRRTALAASLEGLDRLEAELSELRAAEARAGREAEEAKAALVRTDTRLDALVERVAIAERGRAERAGLTAEAEGLEARAVWVGEPFRAAVLRMEKELLAHAQAAFDRSFARYFASLIDDPALVARTDVTFTPEVTVAGETTPAEALSGGERTSLALAFRLALATVVRQLGSVRLTSLLLDEPTDGFSSEQVVRMGELLEELALPQVVLVSHETELAGIADRTIRVVKIDGRSVLDTGPPRRGRTPDDAGPAGPGPVSLAPARPGTR